MLIFPKFPVVRGRILIMLDVRCAIGVRGGCLLRTRCFVKW